MLKDGVENKKFKEKGGNPRQPVKLVIQAMKL
jgi:hypothetical protein